MIDLAYPKKDWSSFEKNMVKLLCYDIVIIIRRALSAQNILTRHISIRKNTYTLKS